MTTWTALTTLPDKARADALAEALEALDPEPIGVGVFEIEDGSGMFEVGAYFTGRPDEVALALLAAVHGAADFAVSEVPETDWVAHVRRELTPVEAGRFFVHGAHDVDKVPVGKTALLIEASMAFGTGHHGTTLGCLRAIDRLAERIAPRRVADIGCGTAVLAMAAASVWPDASVVASDIDPVAVDVARTNLAANGFGRIATLVASGFEGEDLVGPFGLVLANILKGPLLDLAPAMAAATARGGVVVLSGLLTDQAGEVVARYRQAGFELDHRDDIGDWSTLTLFRRG
jgi:ribosomal protein L11 methyltransferase